MIDAPIASLMALIRSNRLPLGWRANMTVLLLVASGTASAQGDHARSDRIAEIHFARSGGLVASQGSVEGTVIIPTGGAARLKAKNPEYSRNLSPREVTQLKSMDVRKLCQAKPRAAAAADQYTYEITLKAADGKTCDLTIDDEPSPELDKLAAGLGRLAEFVRQESERLSYSKLK